eukprot:jgi/Psemu1/36880/gm1.36880_g
MSANRYILEVVKYKWVPRWDGYVSVHMFSFRLHELQACVLRMSSSSDISSALDSYTLEELQQMLTDPRMGTQLANKIEAEVLTRLATKSQNGSPVGILVTPSKQQKMSDQIGQAEMFLSKCTTLIEQMNQETMRVKEDIIKPLQETINSAKKRPPAAKTNEIEIYSDGESNESEEDLNRKPASKPKSKKDNKFSKYDIHGYRMNEYQNITKHNGKTASKPKSTKHNNFSKNGISVYEKNEYQNFTKNRFHHLEAGAAVRKLSRNSWMYDASFPDTLMSSDVCFQKIPNAVMCIHTLYRSMEREPDAIEANKEEQPVQRFTRNEIKSIAVTHADVVTADTGLDFFMTNFPNMKKLDIDLCGLITSQPGEEGTFQHDPRKNAIAVFQMKGRYDEVIRLMEPYIAIGERRTGRQKPLVAFVGAWQIQTDEN